MPPTPQQVAPGVHRVADGLVNFYLLTEGDSVTLLDTGWRSSWKTIVSALASIGRSPGDVQAIVLSHAHPDHLGAAEHARTECPAPVMVHRDDEQRAKGKAKGSSPFALVPGLLPTLWRPSAFGFVLHATRHGFMTPRWVDEVTTVADGERLDVAGHPVLVHTPGHTAGHASWHLPDAGVLLAGDALATLDVLTRERGPRLMPDPLQADPAQARASLDRLTPLAADLLLPGHGEPWNGTPADAVAQACAAA